MDYVDDNCMYMFTAGQATRALAYLNTIVSEFKPNVLGSSTFLASNFSVFPNPSNGTFQIQLKELVAQFGVKIYDITGKVIYENEFNSNSDLTKEIKLNETIGKGVYFMNVNTLDGIITKKIIIE